MRDPVAQADFNAALCRAASVFSGMADALESLGLTFSLLLLKYATEQEEAAAQGGDVDASPWMLPGRASFHRLRQLSEQDDVAERIALALDAFEKANLHQLEGVFGWRWQKSAWLGESADRNQVLRNFLADLDVPALRMGSGTSTVSPGVGAVHLIHHLATQGGQRGLAEFITPSAVSQLMAELMAPKADESVCDPACGLGVLLAACGQVAQSQGSGYHVELCGQDKNGQASAVARLLLLLHAEPAIKVVQGDTLTSPKLVGADVGLRQFDIVVSQPPIGLAWESAQAESDPFARFERGVPPPSKADFAFLSHMVKVMAPETGRMAALVANGVLFRGGVEGQIRRQWLRDNLVDAVISLPPRLLQHTGIALSLLILRQQRTQRDVLLIDATRQFESARLANTFSRENVQWIVSHYRQRVSDGDLVRVVTLDEITENDHDLTVARYLAPQVEVQRADLSALRAEWMSLGSELTQVQDQLMTALASARLVAGHD